MNKNNLIYIIVLLAGVAIIMTFRFLEYRHENKILYNSNATLATEKNSLRAGFFNSFKSDGILFNKHCLLYDLNGDSYPLSDILEYESLIMHINIYLCAECILSEIATMKRHNVEPIIIIVAEEKDFKTYCTYNELKNAYRVADFIIYGDESPVAYFLLNKEDIILRKFYIPSVKLEYLTEDYLRELQII